MKKYFIVLLLSFSTLKASNITEALDIATVVVFEVQQKTKETLVKVSKIAKDSEKVNLKLNELLDELIKIAGGD